MGLLFADSERKVANTLTFVQLIRKHDAEVEALMKENRKKSVEAEKAKKARLFAKQNINRLNNSLRYKATEAKKAELEA